MEKKAVGQLMGGRWEWRGDGWRECKTSREAALKTASRMHTVASEKDGFMSETMIYHRNLPNPHPFEPLFCTRA